MPASQKHKKSPPTQLELPRPRTHGGARAGSGPKRDPRNGVMHREREVFASRYPVHVTMKMRHEVGCLRAKRRMKVIRQCLASMRDRELVRITQWSLQTDHLHLVVESPSGKAGLSRGMQTLATRIAKRINKLLARTGAVFKERYHARILRTPRQVRNALAYVLNNTLRHAAKNGRRVDHDFVDEHSSWTSFDGWRDIAARDRERYRQDERELSDDTTTPAVTWLLRRGWRRHGLISKWEVPGGNCVT